MLALARSAVADPPTAAQSPRAIGLRNRLRTYGARYNIQTMPKRGKPARVARPLCPALLLLGSFAPVLGLGAGPGRIILKSGELIVGDVAKTLPESTIIRTTHGLRSVPRGMVERVEAGVETEVPPRSARTPSEAPSSLRTTQKGKPEVLEGGTALPPLVPPRGDAALPPLVPPRGDVAKGAGPLWMKSEPDRRLDEARSGGAPPVLEMALRGSIDGKPLDPADAFTVSRLTFFFQEVSRPRFSVLPPLPATGRGGKPGTKPAGKNPAAGGPAPEYRAELVANVQAEDLTFFGTQVLRTFRAKVGLRLVRLADKKVVDGLEVVEDEAGDAPDREELCRRAYNRGVEALVKELKKLRTFGGLLTVPENAKSPFPNEL